MEIKISLQRIVKIVGSDARCEGDYDGDITGIAPLSSAGEGELSFLGNPKYRSDLDASNASVLLIPVGVEFSPKARQTLIRVENPSFALALVCRDIELELDPNPAPGIHPSAVVDPSASISPEAFIGPLCVIGEGAMIGACSMEAQVFVGANATIGEGARIQAGARIGAYSVIGSSNRLLPGCVIGSDGYGYEYVGGVHERVPQIGNVVTGANVDIGANTTIDRARFGSTTIGDGTKIDNQVQIAHNVQIGKNCLIVAQVGISGSTTLGDGVVVAGQAGIAGHLAVGSGAQIAGGAAVTRSVPEGKKVRGSPAIDMMLHDRLVILNRKLPNLFKKFDQLEKRIESDS